MKKKVFSVMVVVAMLAAMLVGTTSSVSASPGNKIWSNWAQVTPTSIPVSLNINGTMAPGEWADASVFNLAAPGFPLPVPAWVKNDATNLYIAAQVPDPLPNPLGGDFIQVWFDNGHDGILTAGNEDAKLFSPNGVPEFNDLHWNGAAWVSDATPHGSGAWTFGALPRFDIPTGYTFEFSIPLNSADGQDISASPGDTVGMLAEYIEADVLAGSAGYWPATGNLANPNTWGEIILASAPPAGIVYDSTLVSAPHPFPGTAFPVQVDLIALEAHTPLAPPYDTIDLTQPPPLPPGGYGMTQQLPFIADLTYTDEFYVQLKIYDGNPGGSVTFQTNDKLWFDVYLSDPSVITYLKVEVYYDSPYTPGWLTAAGLDENNLVVYWWDYVTTAWKQCTNVTVDTANDIITIEFTPTSSPRLDQLLGTALGAGTPAAAEARGVSVYPSILAAIAGVIAVGGIGYLIRRRLLARS